MESKYGALTIVVVAAAIACSGQPLIAKVVSFECQSDVWWEKLPATQPCEFDYDLQVLKITSIIHGIGSGPRDYDGMKFDGVTDSPSTLTVVNTITNDTGVAWEGYWMSIGESVGGGGQLIPDSISSTKLTTVTYLPGISFFGGAACFAG